MNRLVLKDNTEIENGFASKSSRNQLMVRIPGNDMTGAVITFSNAEKTETIICYYSIYKTTYTGFTEMYSVQYFEDGDYVEMWLKPAEGVETTVEQEITVPKEYVPAEVEKVSEVNTDVGEESDTFGEG